MKYQFFDLIIDINSQRVKRGNEFLDVSGLNFKFLVFMLENKNEVVSFDELTQAVWSPSIVNNETITQRVRLLRVALGDTEKTPKYIRSVRGQGYQLCQTPKIVDSQQKDKSPSTRNYLLVVTTVFVISLALIFQFLPQPTVDETVNATKSLYDQRLERAQYFLNQREEKDIQRALDLLAQIKTAGQSDHDWLVTKSISISTGVCRYGQDKSKLDQAESLAVKAREFTPNSALASYAVAYTYDCRGNITRAIDEYRLAMSQTQSLHPGIASSLAYLLGEVGRVDESLVLHRQLLASKQQEDFLYMQLGRNYALLQYDALAEHFLKLSFDLYPENVFSNAAYPRFLFEQNRLEESKIALDNAFSRPVHADLYLLSAEWYLENDDPLMTNDFLARAVRAKPDYPLYKTLLEYYQQNTNIDYFVTRLTEIESFPETSLAAIDFLEKALVQNRLGQNESAVDSLKVAVSKGFLDKTYLVRSPLLKDLREMPQFNEILKNIDNIITAQRAKLPAELLSLEVMEM